MKDEFKSLSIKELLSIEMYLENDYEDEDSNWFPLFIKRPNGDIFCQFIQDDDIQLDAKLRMKK